MTVLIKDRHVTCPMCKHNFEVKRKNGGGASYVKKWRRLNKAHLDILTIWLSRENLSAMPRTKEFAYKLCTSYGLKSNPAPFFARISELVGCKVLQQTDSVKSDPHFTETAPTYILDHGMAVKLINNGGVLNGK